MMPGSPVTLAVVIVLLAAGYAAVRAIVRRRRPAQIVPLVQGDTIDGYCGFCGEEGHKALNCTALDGVVPAVIATAYGPAGGKGCEGDHDPVPVIVGEDSPLIDSVEPVGWLCSKCLASVTEDGTGYAGERIDVHAVGQAEPVRSLFIPQIAPTTTWGSLNQTNARALMREQTWGGTIVYDPANLARLHAEYDRAAAGAKAMLDYYPSGQMPEPAKDKLQGLLEDVEWLRAAIEQEEQRREFLSNTGRPSAVLRAPGREVEIHDPDTAEYLGTVTLCGTCGAGGRHYHDEHPGITEDDVPRR